MTDMTYLFRECPICGKMDALEYPDEQQFNELYEKNGGATITVECNRCALTMWEHDYDGSDFEQRVRILANKWNNRVVKEEVDDGK